MADDGSGQNTTWPAPRFFFSVDVDGVGQNLVFHEVSGLDAEAQTIEYRGGDSKVFSTIKMPGIAKIGNVTLKKGIVTHDAALRGWLSEGTLNTPKRRTITIKLLDQDAKPAMTWILTNAWPTKISAIDLRSDGNEIAVETIELAHEGITVASR